MQSKRTRNYELASDFHGHGSLPELSEYLQQPLELSAHSTHGLQTEHLEEITIHELHDALDSVEWQRPTQRLLAAIAYKNGVTQTELAEWFDTGRRTIYSWLQRLITNEPLAEAVSDNHRSGRNRKLSKSDLEEFREKLHE